MVRLATSTAAAIERLDVAAYRIPTDQPESDGTLEWDATTMVVVHVQAAGLRGFGYSYADAAAARLVTDLLVKHVQGRDPLDIPACWHAMCAATRNNGQSGLGMMAVAAVDNALWDLKAKMLGVPLVSLLGAVRDGIPVYGSGGFTSYTNQQLQDQLAGWASQGMRYVKMKIGREPHRDPQRIEAARRAIGERVELFVDANEALDRKQALAMAEWMPRYGVTWFEQPIQHRDLEGMRLLRDRMPPALQLSTGEYAFVAADFLQILQAGAVDVLQADATRCGITGFLQAATLCQAWDIPMSSHCAPALHAHVACACEPMRHMEYFHDHVRIERMLLDGVVLPEDGMLKPDRTRPGLGLELKEADARRYML